MTFDALRQTAQCVGRVVRSKTDYGVVVLADDRFGRKDKRSKLPGWVRQFLSDAQLDLSTSNALGAVRGFLRRMAQPVNHRLAASATLLDKAGVEALAKLPSLDELRGKLVGILQAPAAKLARVAQAPAGKVARVIKARSDQLQHG